MLEEICHHLPPHTMKIVDGTLGHGWHADAMLKTCEEQWHLAHLRGIDRDKQMLEYAAKKLEEYGDRVTLLHARYDQIPALLSGHQIKTCDFILLDIGINRQHVADAPRGFSIKQEWPLDMRFDQTQSFTAKHYLQQVKADQLKKDLMLYGDFKEKRAQVIAFHLLRSINHDTIGTTIDLKNSLKQVWADERKCAVIFQVLRIKVNDELWHLQSFLSNYHSILRQGWRCAIITFHSVEDRIVKEAFKRQEADGIIKKVNKSVIKPSKDEQRVNKASRSAKLRIVEKL